MHTVHTWHFITDYSEDRQT